MGIETTPRRRKRRRRVGAHFYFSVLLVPSMIIPGKMKPQRDYYQHSIMQLILVSGFHGQSTIALSLGHEL